jgi:membrane protease subunit HflC
MVALAEGRCSMTRIRWFVVPPLLLLAIVGLTSPFVIDATEYAVVTRFGRPIRTCTTPGLRWRAPLVDEVIRLDARLLMTEPPAAEYLTLDKKNARVFLVWRVDDPLRYLQTVLTRDAAEARLAAVTSSEIGAALGSVPFENLVSNDSGKMRLSAIVERVQTRIRDTAARAYGIQLVALRVERLAFPQQNEASVFQRMRAERQRIAKQFRSEGDESSIKIRAEADRERARILAEASEKAAKIRGQAEAEAARIYAEALATDPEFYRFVRTLESYDKIIDKETTLVLPADSPLMRDLLTGPPSSRH